MRQRRTARTGFTLVELLVVITIIGMLTAMVFPAIGQVMETFRKAGCASTLRNIYQACSTYDTVKQTFPPAVTVCGLKGKPDVTRRQLYKVGGKSAGSDCVGPNWMSLLLQGMGEPALAASLGNCVQKYRNVCDECSRDDSNNNVGTQYIKAFKCPSAEALTEDGRMTEWGLQNLAKGNYAACMGGQFFVNIENRQTLAGAFEVVDVSENEMEGGRKKASGGWKLGVGTKLGNAGFPDGDSKTILLSEIVGVDNPRDGRGAWAFGGMGGSTFTAHTLPNANVALNPKNNDVIPVCDTNIPQHDKLSCKQNRNSVEVYAAARSSHPNSVNVIMADGTPKSVSDFIDPAVWKAAATRRGSEKVPALDE